MRIISSILTKLGREILLPLQVFRSDGRLDFGERLHVVVEFDGWLLKLTVGNAVHVHFLTGRVAGTARLVHPIWVDFEFGCVLALANGHHQSLVRHDGDVRARVHIGRHADLVPLLLGESVCDALGLELEHVSSRRRVRQMDVDFLLEAASERLIKLPRGVGCAECQDAFSAVAAAVHLDEELGLDATGRFVFALRSLAAKRIDLINKDERRLFLASHLKKILDEALGLTLPLADEVGGGNGEESAFALGCAGLREEGLTGAWWPVQKNALPRLASTGEQLRELDRQNNGFFEGLLGTLKTGHVVPFDVRLLADDGTGERILHLFVLIVVALFLFFLLRGSSSGTTIVVTLWLVSRCSLIIRLVEGRLFDIFCTAKCHLHLVLVNFLNMCTLFILYHVAEDVACLDILIVGCLPVLDLFGVDGFFAEHCNLAAEVCEVTHLII